MRRLLVITILGIAALLATAFITRVAVGPTPEIPTLAVLPSDTPSPTATETHIPLRRTR